MERADTAQQSITVTASARSNERRRLALTQRGPEERRSARAAGKGPIHKFRGREINQDRRRCCSDNGPPFTASPAVLMLSDVQVGPASRSGRGRGAILRRHRDRRSKCAKGAIKFANC